MRGDQHQSQLGRGQTQAAAQNAGRGTTHFPKDGAEIGKGIAAGADGKVAPNVRSVHGVDEGVRSQTQFVQGQKHIEIVIGGLSGGGDGLGRLDLAGIGQGNGAVDITPQFGLFANDQ